jgi:acyl-CoA synthetase (AMP-forming)/AMP-acid ligase II
MSFVPLSRLLPEGRADHHVVAFRHGLPLSFGQFRDEVAACAGAVRAAGCRRGALVARDGWNFAVGLMGLLHGGAEVVVPPNAQPGALAALSGTWDMVLDDPPIMGEPLRLRPLDAAACRLAFYTSGSTGTPKRVDKTLAQMEGEAAALQALWGEALGDAPTLATVAHQHIYGLTFKLSWPLMAGRPFVSLSHELWETLLADLPPGAVLVSSPAHLTRLGGLHVVADRPRLLLSAGAPLPLAAAREAEWLFGVLPTEIYGSTETGAVATRQADAPWRPFPGTAVRREVDGRLSLSCPYVSPDWIECADRIDLEADGGFHLLGRADRVAKIEGKRVGLAEVEAALAVLPEVAEAQVVVLGGTVLAAAVVPTPVGRAALERLGAFRFGRALRWQLSATLEPAGQPRRWRFVERLPDGAMGKRQDAAVTALFEDGRLPPATVRPVEGGFEFDLAMAPDLRWFDGHFPVFPLLPGVVQVDWAVGFARRHLGYAGPTAQRFRIKFKQMIRPGDRLVLGLRTDARGRVTFEYRRGDEVCSVGVLG